MADNVHIEGISDTVAHVLANADAKQSGKFTDNSDTSAGHIGTEQDETWWGMNTDKTVVWALAAYKQINVASGAESYLDIEFKSIYANGTLFQAAKREHIGDDNTYDEFGPDEYNMYVGGTNSFRITTAFASVNDNQNNVDFKVKGANIDDLFYVDASTDRVGVNTATPANKFHVVQTDAVTDAVSYPFKVTHESSGTPAAGFGEGFEFELHDADNDSVVAGALEVVWSDPAGGTEESYMAFKTRDASLTEVMRIASGGVIIGSGDAGVDYTLTFVGENSTGVITWMEGEDYFLFADDVVLGGTLALGGNIKMDGHYLSGDGTDEGLRVDSAGRVTITTPAGVGSNLTLEHGDSNLSWSQSLQSNGDLQMTASNSTAVGSLIIKLGDDAGVEELIVQDSAGAEVATTDSDGNGHYSGTLTTSGGRISNTTRITAATYTILATDEILFLNTDTNAIAADLPAGVEGTHYKIH